MRFEEVVMYLREGKHIRRKSWHRLERIKVHSLMRIAIFIENPINYEFRYYTLSLNDLEADDWEVM